MNKLTKIILTFTNKLKPVLLKIFPHKILRLLKRKVAIKSITNMAKIQLAPFDKNKYKAGINLIGDIKAETGLGQSCRLIAKELAESGLDYCIYHYSQLGANQEKDYEYSDKLTNQLNHNINLIHINPHELGLAFVQTDKSVWDYRYNIAYWLWELEEFPEEWLPCFSCLNEIWTPSEFISNSIRKKTDLPVKTIPYSVNADILKLYDRSYFKLPQDQFLFLTMYDHNSIVERKNPHGVYEAYKKAFSKANKSVGLAVKIINANKEDLKLIQSSLEGYDNIYVITETLDRDQVNSLIKCADVLVSLHRAEGFGLVLAEAMLLGTPTIATNWSSNTEFMNEDVACLVNYSLTTIEKDAGVFKKGNRWADPDITQASEYMKKLFNEKDYYDKLAVKAKAHIEEKLSMEKATGLINKRIEDILNKG
jgi:glycosyltransferase involved in cell wall biosynthesis